MLAVVGCACLFAQTCMLHFSAKHHTGQGNVTVSAPLTIESSVAIGRPINGSQSMGWGSEQQ